MMPDGLMVMLFLGATIFIVCGVKFIIIDFSFFDMVLCFGDGVFVYACVFAVQVLFVVEFG